MKTCCCPVCGTGLSGCLAPPPPFPGKRNNQTNNQFTRKSLISLQFTLFRKQFNCPQTRVHAFKVKRECLTADVDHIAIFFRLQNHNSAILFNKVMC